jgi:hypothetical protein
MVFVDGENLTIRAQRLLSEKNITPTEGTYWSKNRFIWQPGRRGNHIISPGTNRLDYTPVRAYYYTSVMVTIVH